MKENSSQELAPETLAAQALGIEDRVTGSVIPPIHLSTTYTRTDDYGARETGTYIRDASPTVKHAEQVVCELEGGKEALGFGSGLGACTALFHALENGDHVAVSRVIYYGVLTWLEEFAEQRGLSYTLFDNTDLEGLGRILRSRPTALVWIETPANPDWSVTDIAAVSELAHSHGARVAVDSTVATPVLTRPLELGADYVCHSATKFLNGHSDVLGGMLVAADSESALWDRTRKHRKFAGPMMAAMDAWLLVRGLRTLFLRIPRQCESALAVASFLAGHSRVERTYYPGLSDDPGYEVASRQMQGGYGGMVSFQVKGERQDAIDVALKARVFKAATSLGGVESLIEHRKTSESDVTDTPENLLRVSVGIESADDLLADLEQMLG